jgi:tRNA-specific 2-thiouridylase
MAAPQEPIKVSVQIRYRSRPVPATLIPLPEVPGTPLGNRVKLVFDDPQFGVTPGQAAVWYDDDLVLGGGIIEVAQPVTDGESMEKEQPVEV